MKNQRVRYHIIFWVAYFLFQAYLEFEWMKTTETYGKWPTVKQALYSLGAEAMLLPIKLSTTYLFLYIVRKVGGQMKKNWLAWILATLLMVGATLLTRLEVIHVIIKEFYNDAEMVAAQQKSYTIFRFLWGMIDVMFYIGIVFAIEQFLLNQQSQHREKLLHKEKLEAELKFLRTQTNPHFLFNTLNNIYALARKKSDDTANVVMKLSKLLRFMLYESRNDSISIAEEIRVLEDYIELERIRYNERLSVRFNKSIDCDNQAIAPLILLPFVENAFKHGASEARFSSYIYIDIELKEGQLKFTVENSKDEEPEKPITENIGLSNVRRQLELMYPEHGLHVQNEKNRFYIHLTINLRKHATVSMHHSGR